MTDATFEQIGKIENRNKGEIANDFSQKILLGRIGEAEDIAKLVSYLASKDSDYMTGQSIIQDGGILLS